MRYSWDMSGRDVVPDLRAAARPADVGAALLYAMLKSDGTDWRPPYESVRSNLQIRSKVVSPELQEQAESRFRTYKTMFRGLGLLYDDEFTLHSTELGQRLLSSLESQYQKVDDIGQALFINSRPTLAAMVAPTLAKYQLSNPLTTAVYPAGTDVRPLMAIWRAMRGLDNKLHWEELGRSLTGCLRDEDVPAAIAAIQAARLADDYDLKSEEAMTKSLGPRTADQGTDQSDRLDTWFSRAGFKGLLLEPRDRSDGYRYLAADCVTIIDQILDNPPSFNPTTNKAEYAAWLGRDENRAPESAPNVNFGLVPRVVERCRRYGGTHIIALVGPAGTGKTRTAHDAALVLTEGDPSMISTVQFHAGFTYEEFVGGLAPQDGTFKPVPGVLVVASDEALKNPDRTYVLVIDELSRADVANVLGELLTYVEYRGRPFIVPALEREVVIAPNLVIIATLNPSDRSVVNLDDALIRRMRQIPVLADSDALLEILEESGMRLDLRAEVHAWFTSLPPETPFGHGVFVGIENEEDLHDLWHESLKHFLRRGGLSVFPDAESVERGYIWRNKELDQYSYRSDIGVEGMNVDVSV